MVTPRFFNTAGPVNEEDHYLLPPLSRWNTEEILTLIDQKKYFILHAPRQSGKTSGLLALQKHINQEGRYHCLYINVEVGQSARENVPQALGAILSELGIRAEQSLGDSRVDEIIKTLDVLTEAHHALNRVLSKWCSQLDKPLILFIDEIDALVGDTLIGVLRQLRAGYDKRPQNFPQSIILCGVRDVRDYRIHSSTHKDPITGGSAFNIKAKSLTVGNFTQEQIKTLLSEHTQTTGQVFEEPVFELFWEYTQGQPWLVNALAYEACFDMREGKIRTNPITASLILQAKENLILRRDTHLDQLTDKLREDRVRRVVQPLLAGEDLSSSLNTDDVQYCVDLGLVTQKTNGSVSIANRIYQEVIPRALNWDIQSGMSLEPQPWYLTPDQSRIDMSKLMREFQAFFRKHIDIWLPKFHYPEAGPQLLLMAYLQRIINGGGRIDREYGLGRGRVDLYIEFKQQKMVLELKVLKEGQTIESVLQKGLQQTAQYMEHLTAPEGHLVLFDRSGSKSWDERIFEKVETLDGRTVTVWGM